MRVRLLSMLLFGILNALPLTDKHEEESVESPVQALTSLKRSAKKYGLKPRLANRIIRGQEADEHEFPWIGSLRINGYHFCGGSLFRKRYVVTSAQCFNFNKIGIMVGAANYSERYMLPLYEVVLGDHYINTTEPEEQIFRIAKFLKLEPETNRSGVALFNDVAVVKLDRTANLNQYVSLIRLSNSSMGVSPGDTLTTAGWGYSKRPAFDAKLGYVTFPENFSNVLRVTQTKVVERESCSNYFPGKTAKGYNMTYGHKAGEDIICTREEYDQGVSVNRGDTGNPLMYYDHISKEWVQLGIYSYIHGRVGEELYSNVTYFFNKIEEMVTQLEGL